MFRSWKSAVNTPIGMFEQWGLDQMLHLHRTRMSTFYREGKLTEGPDLDQIVAPETVIEADNSNDNPYLAGEHGETTLPEIKEAPEATKGEFSFEMYGPVGRKPYFQYVLKRGGVKRRPEAIELCVEEKVGIYELWAKVQHDQDPGMYGEWRKGGQKAQETHRETGNVPFGREATEATQEAKPEAMSREDAIKAVMQGDLAASRQIHTRQLRIVVCSTFCDTKAERQRLTRDIYPRIRDICAQKEVEFLAVDLGWGQADGTLTEASFAKMCMAEFEKTLEKSLPITNMLIFLTDKYGSPGLPPYVNREEFELILSGIEDEDARGLVKRWYCLDENAVPPAYRLQAVPAGPTLIAPDKHERRVMSARWTSTESQLMSILQQGVRNSEQLTEQQLEKWTLSPYDLLITRGVLQRSDAAKRALCVVRDIAQAQRPFNIPEATVNSRLLQQYVDMDHERPIPDKHSRKKLHNIREGLKNKQVKCKKYVVNWSPYGITKATHEAYVDHVGETVRRHLTTRVKAILAGVNAPDDLMEEVASHSRFCVQQSDHFHGRQELLEQVLQHICHSKKGEKEGNPLLVLHGVGGSGKTALVAKCGSLVKALLCGEQQETEPVLVIRFCRLVKQMTTIHLLRSLCLQIHRAYRGEDLDNISSDIPTLNNLFNELLNLATEQRPLVIMLDSVDNVTGANSDEPGLMWLPYTSPAHVQIVVSTRSSSDAFKVLTEVGCKSIEVPTLTLPEAEPMLKEMLSTPNRTLTKDQEEYVLSAAVGRLEETPTVLRLKLLFDSCKGWASYDYLTVYRHTVPAMYGYMLERLELEHGKVLVAHVFSLILVARCGISEAELVDLLSGDEEVLEAVLLINQPPVRRFPQSALSRMFQGLNEHLTEVYGYGRTVLVFTSRQMEEAIRKRYLGTTPHMTEKYCALLADYFSGEMQDRYPGRGLAPQPLYWRNPKTGRVHFNRAKLTELPAASSRAPYPSSVHSPLYDLTFIAAKCAAGLYRELLHDYSLAEELLRADEQLNAYKEFVWKHGLDIAKNPRDVTSLALGMAPESAVHAQAKALTESGNTVVPWLHRLPSYATRRSRRVVTPHNERAMDLVSTSSVFVQVS